jgi:hypothetical protein
MALLFKGFIMLYIERKEQFNGNTTKKVYWLLKTTNPNALYKIIQECSTKKQALELLNLYNNQEWI